MTVVSLSLAQAAPPPADKKPPKAPRPKAPRVSYNEAAKLYDEAAGGLGGEECGPRPHLFEPRIICGMTLSASATDGPLIYPESMPARMAPISEAHRTGEQGFIVFRACDAYFHRIPPGARVPRGCMEAERMGPMPAGASLVALSTPGLGEVRGMYVPENKADKEPFLLDSASSFPGSGSCYHPLAAERIASGTTLTEALDGILRRQIEAFLKETEKEPETRDEVREACGRIAALKDLFPDELPDAKKARAERRAKTQPPTAAPEEGAPPAPPPPPQSPTIDF
ncbi:MAG: hypothetical protein IT285_14785 [Bdellovibrionales bacterium]|nr:hypothetical protein [Bdellovibrionales bacterium]